MHVHSDYSLLDGMGKINDYVAAAKAAGMDALALTDHGVMYGAYEFYTTARKAGIKPILGVEMYVAARGRLRKETREDQGGAHLLALARDERGYRNLLALTTAAHLEGYYQKPRIDHELLSRHSDGLVITSACLGGEVAQLILHGREREAMEWADLYRSIAGRDNYFIEVQSHPVEEQERANKALVALARAMEIPLVATTDAHYVWREDAPIQDILLCIQTGKYASDTNRMRMGADTYYLRTPEEVRADWAELPEACDNTLLIAEMCDLDLQLGKWLLPRFEVPGNFADEDEYLRHLLREALTRLKPHLLAEGKDPKAYGERAKYECDIICAKGYSAYFLIVADFVAFARARGIAATSRGSAAGSLVSYLLGITTADPLEYDLPFERFLNAYRPSPPDIDMDFEDGRREEVIRYVSEKYGEDRVAQIITFGTMESRAAVRDVARVLEVPFGDADTLAKLIPDKPQPWSIEEALEGVPALKARYDGDGVARRVLDTARRLEGVTRHASTHAAGVIIGCDPLVQHAPMQKDAKGGKPLIQYEMGAAEGVGLLKMDFLGLANLSVLGRALGAIRQARGVELDLASLPLDDPKAYALLATGETTGIFQMESAGMRRYVRELRPSSVRDIAAMIALYRPGPMEFIPNYIRRKNGEEPVSYLVPQLEPILRESYGVLVYQDDILLISIEVAGYTWEEADKLRKAVGKKIKAELDAQQEKFIKGCQKHGGISQEKAEELWGWMLPFCRYGFGRAHACAYSLVAYQTAYLKANYPSEYMSAFLSVFAAKDNTEKVAAGIAECRRMGVEVLPPDVNRSGVGFSLEPGSGRPGEPTPIRFGLGAVRNLGTTPVQALIAAREAQDGGRFAGLSVLCGSVDGRTVNRRGIESLIKAGALDGFGGRAQLLAALDSEMTAGQKALAAREAGQMGLFELGAAEKAPAAEVSLPEVEPETEAQRLAWEKEMLGLYVSSHPLSSMLAGERPEGLTLLSELDREMIEERVRVIGVLEGGREVATKRKSTMYVATLSDTTGAVDLVVFSSVYERYRENLREDIVVEVWGRVEERGEGLQLACETVRPYVPGATSPAPLLAVVPSAIEPEPEPGGQRFRVHLPITDHLDADIARFRDLRALLEEYPGDARVEFDIQVNQRQQVVFESQDVRVSVIPELIRRLEQLLAPALKATTG